MIIGEHILAHKAKPLLEALPCDALYFVLDKRAMEAIDPDFGLFVSQHKHITLELEGKDLSLASRLWDWLIEEGATRASIVVGIGGGTLSDVLGFVAGTYMRGIRSVYIPTTLLAMVDASVGGKAGIDYAERKNMIGVFHEPTEVIVDVCFLDSLPIDELFSGYGEVIKTALLSGEELWHRLLQLPDPQSFDHACWLSLIEACISYKSSIVAQDPHEKIGLRAVLNLGHTTAHALEMYSRRNPKALPLRHGEAVVIGLIVEAYLAHKYLGLDKRVLRQLMSYTRELYPHYSYQCKAYPELIRLMQSDKKNSGGSLRFALLRSVGQAELWTAPTTQVIEEALDFYREAWG